ncbi:DUF1330 domain-containing protein [Mycobacterium sp. CBMA293]|uniref:DUF1330 domain-containing protein n=1 Tax=unclassified Mycolicibacterium TaxID=2636767 RepID=UPI0012DCDA5D|nr:MULTISPECIES: DUF1330 domain-containing protein [unclassified Mycolicibacterium]MUL49791.1 DUF1330 domain-containing protein [Mycolicibacterium sp. CBMA 360]MUL58545.1 DUF1330 domain-containing protein [Mycolicibacterium sp. CBMA 335]MUL74003.1 DUF1330 domain-containing protein [Mycolicibacterium sp. CBMA 311]MUL93428.1 DUF1330 domain-containing protein [Mycolicibacterium sp. CBMA 230]MUM04643.1 hypothetical protein [Mycolicibacterium sp. CBMA 213]
MAAYALCELQVDDVDAMRPYLDGVSATIAAYGGRYLVAGVSPEVIEGGAGEYPIKVVLEFASVEAFKTWYDSSEYQAILPHRQRNSTANFYVMDGVPSARKLLPHKSQW